MLLYRHKLRNVVVQGLNKDRVIYILVDTSICKSLKGSPDVILLVLLCPSVPCTGETGRLTPIKAIVVYRRHTDDSDNPTTALWFWYTLMSECRPFSGVP
jgi:hypothetical protein